MTQPKPRAAEPQSRIFDPNWLRNRRDRLHRLGPKTLLHDTLPFLFAPPEKIESADKKAKSAGGKARSVSSRNRVIIQLVLLAILVPWLFIAREPAPKCRSETLPSPAAAESAVKMYVPPRTSCPLQLANPAPGGEPKIAVPPAHGFAFVQANRLVYLPFPNFTGADAFAVAMPHDADRSATIRVAVEVK